MTDCSAALEEAQRNLFSVTKPIVQGNTLVAPPDMDLNVFGMCEYVETFGCLPLGISSEKSIIRLSSLRCFCTDALTAVWVVTSSQHSAVSVRYAYVMSVWLCGVQGRTNISVAKSVHTERQRLKLGAQEQGRPPRLRHRNHCAWRLLLCGVSLPLTQHTPWLVTLTH